MIQIYNEVGGSTNIGKTKINSNNRDASVIDRLDDKKPCVPELYQHI